MREIKAILQPHVVSRVVRALHALPHFPGLTMSDARGQGRGRGEGGSFKLTEDDIDYHRKVILRGGPQKSDSMLRWILPI